MNRTKTKSQQKTTLIVVVITAFITTFTGSALNLSIPDIGRQFGADADTASWLITGYTLAVAAFSVPIGRLADITHRKTILAAGLVIFTACCTAAVFSASAAMLLAARIIQGIGAAMIFSTNTAVLISVYPAEKRGRVLGYSLASTYIGMSAGPVIGGFLNYNFGWRSIFVLTGILGLAAFIASAFGLPKEKHGDSAVGLTKSSRSDEDGFVMGNDGRCLSMKANMDVRGNLLYITAIVTLMYGLSETAKGVWAVALAVFGLAVGVLFVRHELRCENPVVNVRLFTENRGYAFSNLAALMNYGATFAISYLISVYLQVVMGYSSQTAGLIMIAQPAVMAVLSPITGRISDRLSPFKLSSAGMAFCAAGTAVFIFIDEGSRLWMIITALVIAGLGFSLFSSPNTNAVMSCVSEKEYGVASSVLATMRSIGHTVSMVIVTIVITRFMSDTPLQEASADVLIHVINLSFVIFTVICGAGVFVSMKRK